MHTIMGLYMASGAVLVALSLPMIRRKVPPNPWYGFRVRQTQEDPATWYAANEYAGKGLAWVGVCALVAPPLIALWPNLSLDAYALVCLAVTMVALAVCLMQSFRYLHDLAEP